MVKLFRVRKPKLRFGKKGISLSGGGVSFGSNTSRVNISKSGVSSSFGIPGLRYNTRRGLTVGGGRRRARRGGNCGLIALLVLGVSGTAIGAIGVSFFSII